MDSSSSSPGTPQSQLARLRVLVEEAHETGRELAGKPMNSPAAVRLSRVLELLRHQQLHIEAIETGRAPLEPSELSRMADVLQHEIMETLRRYQGAPQGSGTRIVTE